MVMDLLRKPGRMCMTMGCMSAAMVTAVVDTRAQSEYVHGGMES